MGRKQASEMNFGLEVGKGFLGKLVQAVFGFIGVIIFARVLGPTNLGGFYLLLTLVEIVRRPITGVSQAVIQRYSKADSARRELLGAQFLFVGIGVAIVVVGATAFGPWLTSYTGVEAAPLLFVVLFATVASFSPFQSLLSSIGKLGVQTWIDTLRSIATFAMQLVLVVRGLGSAGMAYGLSLGTVAMFPITHYYLRMRPRLPSIETVRSVWSFARYSTLTSIVSKAYDRFDVLLLGFLASPAAAGHYEVAYKLAVPAMLVAGVASSGLFAKVSDLHSRDEEVSEDVVNTLSFSAVFAIPMFFGALAVGREVVVTAYGEEYIPAASLLLGLTLYLTIRSQTTVFDNVVNGLDMPEYQLRASATAFAVNIPLGVWLYFQIGPLGVVVATVCAELIHWGLLAVPVRNNTDATLLPWPLVEQATAAGIMFVTVTVANRYLPVSSWFDLGILLAVGGTTYFVTLTVLSRRFRVTIRGVANQAGIDV